METPAIRLSNESGREVYITYQLLFHLVLETLSESERFEHVPNEVVEAVMMRARAVLASRGKFYDNEEIHITYIDKKEEKSDD